MKKSMIRALGASLALCVALLMGCGGPGGQGSSGVTPEGATQPAVRTSIVCTTFPQYDWMRAVLGDRTDEFDLTLLLDKGTDLHSFQPSVEDMATVRDAGMIVYVGGTSDAWIDDALRSAPDVRAVRLMDSLGDSVREEEVVEGMQAEGEEDGHGSDAPEYDEHVWLSLRNAERLVGILAEQVSELDPQHASEYQANAQAYAAELAELDGRYAQMAKDAKHKAVVVADRFPFRYLMDDYGIGYYAAFVGCSAETEASFETVAFLSDKVDELGLGHVIVLEDSDQRIAQTVIQNTKAKDQRIVVMDSLQSTSAEDVAQGRTYLGAMEENLKVLGEVMG